MKTRKIILGFCLLFLGTFVKGQNGLENIYVERYYVADAIDAANSNPAIPVGAVTYRIYADLLPGYKLQTVYGEQPVNGGPAHPMTMTTTTYFFNQEDYGNSIPTFSASNAKKNTVMLDSWLSTAGACNGYKGVPKSEDNGVNNFVNSNSPQLLQNNAAQAGIPLTTQDGMMAGTVPTTGTLGIGDETLGLFGDGTANGNTFFVADGSWYCLAGATGATPATNKVLIAQITTDGIFHFELNMQIGTPTGGTQKYVHSNPTGVELSIPSIKQTLYPIPVVPTVSISDPTEGSTFTVGSPFAIAAAAADIDGTVTQVEFFVDGNSIGVDVLAPFSATYTGLSVASHVLTAKATDNDLQFTVSSPVNISVIAAVPPASTTWTGNIDNDWTKAGNWNPAVPGTITAVTIPSGVTNFPTLTAPATIASILINDGASFIGSEFLTVGTVLVKRTFTNNKWHFLSSPVASNTFGQTFSNSLVVWAKEWNPTTSAWVYKTGAQAMLVGKGYSVGTSAPPVTANFTGTLNSTSVTAPLVFNSGVNPTWNLLGNPFQSAIDWDNLSFAGSVGGSVAVYNGSTYNYWNGSAGFLTDGIIPAGNGFFVSTTANGSSVTIPLASRVHSNIPFYKESAANLLAIQTNGNGSEDHVYVHFNDNATPGYDTQFDAQKLWGLEEAPQIYSTTNSDVLAINELPMEGNEVVSIGFKCNTTGQYSLNATGIETFDYSTPIILEDLKLNTKQDLRKNAVYSFDYDAADDANRFKLHFKSTTGIIDETNSEISVYSFVRDVVVNNSTALAGEAWVYDMAGREMAHTSLSSQAKTTIPMHVAVGAYMVKVVTAKATVNQKVFIK
jgi:hypothetical protein